LRRSSADAANNKQKEQCFGPQSCLGIRCFLAGVPSTSMLSEHSHVARLAPLAEADEKAPPAEATEAPEVKEVKHEHARSTATSTPSPRVRGHKEDAGKKPTASPASAKSKTAQRSKSATTLVEPVEASHASNRSEAAALRRQVDSIGEIVLEDDPASTLPSLMQVTFIFAGFFLFFLVTTFMFYEQIVRMINPIVAASGLRPPIGYKNYEGETHEPMCRL